ncbi:hypothetical protein OV090_41785 [Nannocystis sp. RBIL2]|uniref:hypothetical protein n=1 Tax=Nannocystis sp. RBIL2 TaxID=2996788 RepID=UPI00226E1E29|nr:hypothetical protein [Nannocystis sp. RBIL2]MCY1071348.1 hypothetical protein [Nannocystis sp. RBIL2]
MRIAAASLASLLLVTLGCKSEPPPSFCFAGLKEVKDPGLGFEGVGFPAGGIACASEDPRDSSSAYVAYREGTAEEVAAKLVAHMAAAGWKELPLPAATEKANFEMLVAGQDPGITKLFAKDGSQERRLGIIEKGVIVHMHKQDCAPKPGGAVNDWCQ